MCPSCKSLQNATKRLSINQAPRILIVTIKRFDMFGRKITKRIRYPSAVNLKSFTDAAIDRESSSGGSGDLPATKKIKDELYDLYGVVIHVGSSTNSGHYYAYCKGVGNDSWFECNDSHIGRIHNADGVLNKEAYLLFY